MTGQLPQAFVHLHQVSVGFLNPIFHALANPEMGLGIGINMDPSHDCIIRTGATGNLPTLHDCIHSHWKALLAVPGVIVWGKVGTPVLTLPVPGMVTCNKVAATVLGKTGQRVVEVLLILSQSGTSCSALLVLEAAAECLTSFTCA